MSKLPVNTGAYRSHTSIEGGVEVVFENMVCRIFFYNAFTARIRYSNEKSFTEDFSYAVIAKPAQIPFHISETDDSLSLKTEGCKLVVAKNSGTIAYYNANGTLLCQQSEGLSVSRIGEQTTLHHDLQEGERFIGLGEKTGNLDRRGSAYVHWNTDYFAYPVNADPIYCSTPFYIGVHHQTQYGVFLDNSHRSVFNFGASNHRFSSVAVDAGEMNYYLIAGQSLAEIIEHYTFLTGRISMPPKWSLGFQQCRYSYYPDTEVMRIAKTFREKKIPCDVIYLDIHYMDAYKCFTFDKEKFANPQQLTAGLQEMGFQTTVILDPGVKTEPGYTVYDSGKAKDVYVKYADGSDYECSVWPGKSVMPDFTYSETRLWWKELMSYYTSKGVRGFWNDMNEPASWGQNTPDNTLFCFDGHHTTHREARNVYGMQMARSTYEGARAQLNNERPFVLTRAGFSGIQRYAAVWTGDNVASDEHMLLGVRLINSLGLAGVPFSGVDVGGFCGSTTPALFARWISVAAFSPFFRVHKMINAISSEPWTYGEEVTDIARNYISLRYRLMPYIYSLFYEASQTGKPVARTLALTHTHDENVYQSDFQNQFMLGDFLMICPCNSTDKFMKVYLPDSDWYDLYTDKKFTTGIHTVETPLERLPVFVKAGAVIPIQNLVQSLQQEPATELEIHTYSGASGAFVLYEDDGLSYNYESGAFRVTDFTYADGELKWKNKGSYAKKYQSVKLINHAVADAKEYYRFVEPVSKFDPFYQGKDAIGYCNVTTSIIDF